MDPVRAAGSSNNRLALRTFRPGHFMNSLDISILFLLAGTPRTRRRARPWRVLRVTSEFHSDWSPAAVLDA